MIIDTGFIFALKKAVPIALKTSRVILVSILLIISACASSPRKDIFQITYIAANNLNPDINGRPSPVAITLYRLANSSAFEKSDYLSLVENDQVILSKDLLSKEVVILRPGEILQKRYILSGKERAFGIVAGYRIMDSSDWQLVHSTPKARSRISKTFNSDQSLYDRTILVGKNALKLKPLEVNNEKDVF